MSYKWIHPPIKFTGFDSDDALKPEEQCVQDDINQAAVGLGIQDIPEEDHKMYDLNAFEEDEVVETIYGFFLSGDASSYGGGGRNTLDDPLPQDVYVAVSDGVYLPIGQHSNGTYNPGDYLISIEDYEAISSRIYTPATYTCAPVRQWDPHKQIRSWAAR